MLNEDILFDKEQPYVTPTSVQYSQLLKGLSIEQLAKRSDIMVTSTLSMSIFPKDKRLIERIVRHKMEQAELREFTDQRNAFNALAKEHIYQYGQTKDKEKDYRDTYQKSFVKKTNFTSKTLVKFKKDVKLLNSNKKQLVKKHDKIIA